MVDPLHELVEIVFFAPDRFDYNAPGLLPHLDSLIEAQLSGLHHGSRNPHGSAIAPLLDHNPHAPHLHPRSASQVAMNCSNVSTLFIHPTPARDPTKEAHRALTTQRLFEQAFEDCDRVDCGGRYGSRLAFRNEIFI
jgi:hypothetical protein